jgi:hypothetical protein
MDPVLGRSEVITTSGRIAASRLCSTVTPHWWHAVDGPPFTVSNVIVAVQMQVA